MRYKLIILLNLLIICGVFTQSVAQLYTMDIDRSSHSVHKSKPSGNQRTENDLTLSLPFWDDFSTSKNNSPDTLLWKIGENVEVSAGAGLNAPTINVASFNGIKIDGSPYSINAFEQGDTDVLASHFIDLSGLSDIEKNTVYLSFFYQKQGNGELPDDRDGIRIEFMDSDSAWVVPPSFQANSLIGANITDTDFHQVIIKIEGDEFFHNEFRFRFVATGRQTGPYDTWNIDYIYLNKGRNINDLGYPDRSFTMIPTSPWRGFDAMPVTHFLTNPSGFVVPLTSQYHDLGNGIFDTEVSNYTLEGHVSFTRADTTVNYIDIIEFDNSKISNQSDITFTTDNTLDVGPFTNNTTEAEVTLKLHADTGELQNQAVNTLLNDTVYATYYLKDYYAYDDGTAEKAAGVNSLGDQIAYQFPYNKTGSKDSILVGIDVYFPKSIGHDQFNKTVKFKVWNNNDNLPNELIYAQTSIIPKIDTLNKFVRYNFVEELNLADTFYIGWEQLTVERIYVGLDKNNDTQGRIFYNIIGDWLPNEGDIVGSLMLRPVFGEVKDPDDNTITSIVSDKLQEIILYPNPSNQYCHIKCNNEAKITVFDLNGRQIQVPVIKSVEAISLDFGNFPEGMYLIKFIDKQYIRTEKFILRK